MPRRPMFTAEEVAEMRRRIDSKEITVVALAREKNTTRQTIHSVLKRPEKASVPTAPGPVQVKAPRGKKEKPAMDPEAVEEWFMQVVKDSHELKRCKNQYAMALDTIKTKNTEIERLRGENNLLRDQIRKRDEFRLLVSQGDIPSPLGVEERR